DGSAGSDLRIITKRLFDINALIVEVSPVHALLVIYDELRSLPSINDRGVTGGHLRIAFDRDFAILVASDIVATFANREHFAVRSPRVGHHNGGDAASRRLEVQSAHG